MNLRQRIVLIVVVAALLPLAIVAWGLRSEWSARSEIAQDSRHELALRSLREFEKRAEAQSLRLTHTLDAIARHLLEDNAFRAAYDAGRIEEPPVIDIAPSLMALTGLDILQIVDARNGRILSSGHFRQRFGLVDDLSRAVPEAGQTPSWVMAKVRRPSDEPLVQLQRRSLSLGSRTLHLVGGWLAGSLLAQLDGDSPVHLEWKDDQSLAPTNVPVRAVPFLSLRDGRLTRVDASVCAKLDTAGGPPSDGPENRWILGALAASLLLIVLSARFAANWISRPLVHLVDDVSRYDLRRQLVRSESTETLARRQDEIGDLGRAFLRLRERLRTSTDELREADRRLALGDIARQVNHDLKNGFMPLRNVFQHLSQLEQSDPSEFVRVFRERRRTLEASLEYLEELSTNYAKLSLPDRREVIELHPILEEIAQGMSTRRVIVDTRLEAREARLRADPVAVRRIAENLVRNARDSYGDSKGRVILATADTPEGQVKLSIIDQGKGMTPEERDRMFEHFFTTKSTGMGLGLGIVQRLVSDVNGVIDVETAPDEGTNVMITLPCVGGASHES